MVDDGALAVTLGMCEVVSLDELLAVGVNLGPGAVMHLVRREIAIPE